MCEPAFKILAVDDEAANLQILNQILKDDYAVFAARSGKAALQKAGEDKPDLILLDVVMPEMDGFEALSALKNDEATRDIPVIIITSLNSVEDEEKGFTLGAVDYITKPFNAAVVKARVQTHLKILKQIKTIERFGMMDSLTELPNRRSFDQQLALEWARAARDGTPISLLMIDLDHFKDVNDRHGHPMGDRVLQQVSGLFIAALKHVTDLVFRWGGEEFAVILPGTEADAAVREAEAVRICVAENDTPLSVTVSIGVASVTPAEGGSAENLTAEADRALYRAKSAGRNRVERAK